jgi:prophage regulatory protein
MTSIADSGRISLARDPKARDRLIDIEQVKDMVGLGRTQIYKLMNAGRFPIGIRLSAKAVRWSEAAVQQWISDRCSEHGAAPVLAAVKVQP